MAALARPTTTQSFRTDSKEVQGSRRSGQPPHSPPGETHNTLPDLTKADTSVVIAQQPYLTRNQIIKRRAQRLRVAERRRAWLARDAAMFKHLASARQHNDGHQLLLQDEPPKVGESARRLHNGEVCGRLEAEKVALWHKEKGTLKKKNLVRLRERIKP